MYLSIIAVTKCTEYNWLHKLRGKGLFLDELNVITTGQKEIHMSVMFVILFCMKNVNIFSYKVCVLIQYPTWIDTKVKKWKVAQPRHVQVFKMCWAANIGHWTSRQRIATMFKRWARLQLIYISQVLVEIRFQSIFVASTTKFELWIVFKTQSYMQFHRKRASHPANIDHLKFLSVQIWIETTFKRKKN